jgi:predicted metal-binding membrane protein
MTHLSERAASDAVTGGRSDVGARGAAVVATLGVAGASWVIAVRQVRGMDMGVATSLGSFASFIAAWVPMMAAMMLPGAVPAALRRVQAGARGGAVLVFAGSYLAVWALVGVAVYGLDRPHGTRVAGVIAIVAGGFELTQVKRRFRQNCRQHVRSGFGFGLSCIGSSFALMALLAALGVMSITWMAVVGVVIAAQKILPARAALDVPLALAIAALGALILISPASIPGLMPSM